VDTEAAMEALLSHVGRVIKNESTTVADCRTHIRGLQRKLKSNKELLDHRVSGKYLNTYCKTLNVRVPFILRISLVRQSREIKGREFRYYRNFNCRRSQAFKPCGLNSPK